MSGRSIHYRVDFLASNFLSPFLHSPHLLTTSLDLLRVLHDDSTYLIHNSTETLYDRIIEYDIAGF